MKLGCQISVVESYHLHIFRKRMCTMQTIQRYWYAILLFCLTLSVGGWVLFSHRSDTHIGTAGTSTRSEKLVTPVVTPDVKSAITRVVNAHLVIPSIGINAAIEPVGVLPDGDLGVPTHNQWEGVGWYKDGPYPGERGSAVIDGHLDRPGGAPAVFWKLQDIHAGDTVMIVDASGKTLHFRVMRTASYAPQDAPLKNIFADTSGTFLNLITCAGQWIPSQHQTTLRLIVYTKLVM